MIKLLRVDDRLLHGQISTYWVEYLKIDRIYVINDEVCHDEFSKMALSLAKPKHIEVCFYELKEGIEQLINDQTSDARVLAIVNCMSDALHVLTTVTGIHSLNIGGLRAVPGVESTRISGSVMMSDQDIAVCRLLSNQGVQIEIRQIPGEKATIVNF